MQAVIYKKYGTPDQLRLVEVPTPTPTDQEVLIKIHACSINGSDRENLVGKPLYARMSGGGLRKPGKPILGSDIAGTVAAVGKNHTEFQVGDELFGELPGYHGGFAEYVCTSGETLALKPANLTFSQAAAIPQAGAIARQGIREQGQVQAGQQVLINGAG
ncbi:MAG: alcohol dehydrogenase catalytic domain-containing protein, partial [Caldilineaceae bacterium]|nr:alcohol dehydrogenase catalytic domain-containing protein [Caldilineaceae bacterium]